MVPTRKRRWRVLVFASGHISLSLFFFSFLFSLFFILSSSCDRSYRHFALAAGLGQFGRTRGIVTDFSPPHGASTPSVALHPQFVPSPPLATCTLSVDDASPALSPLHVSPLTQKAMPLSLYGDGRHNHLLIAGLTLSPLPT